VSDGPDLVDRIIGTPNLYVYSFFKNSGDPPEGHSVAFDTRDTKFWFFDANTGLYVMKDATKPTILAFLDLYWDAEKYKLDFAGGNRELYKYK
jgi:hypothetical protein